MKGDFVPRRVGTLDAFEENFLAKLENHAPTLGLDPEEVAKTNEIITSHRTSYSSMNSKKQLSLSANEEQGIKRLNAMRELRRIAKKIKASKSYDKAIGDDLGIIGPETLAMIPGDMKPILSASFNGQEVVIRYKKSRADGIKLFLKRAGENDFKHTATETSSKYIDRSLKLEADKPEQREYYAIYIFDYVEIGHRSDVIKVVVP